MNSSRSALGNLELRVSRSIRELGPDWEGLQPASPFLAAGWLTCLEEHATTTHDLRYVTLWHHGELFGAAVCEMAGADRCDGTFDKLIFGRAAPNLRKMGVTCEPTLVCRAFDGYGLALATKPGLSGEERSTVRHQLILGIYTTARSAGASVALSGVTAADQVDDILQEFDFVEITQFPVARLSLPWNNFTGYRAELRSRSKSVDKDIRREVNGLRKSGVDVRRFAPSPNECTKLHELASNNYDKHNAGAFPFRESFFSTITDSAAELGVIFGAFQHGSLIAFSLMLTNRSNGWGIYYGCDYAAVGNVPVYFNLVFNQPIEFAIDNGYEHLFYGPGLLGTKQRRGCDILSTRTFYSGASRVSRTAMRPALSFRNRLIRRRAEHSLTAGKT